MTTKALVIVFVALSMVMLSGVGYFAFETYKILKDARKLCRSFSLFKKQWFTSTI